MNKWGIVTVTGTVVRITVPTDYDKNWHALEEFTNKSGL
jgi:hypothetical protein